MLIYNTYAICLLEKGISGAMFGRDGFVGAISRSQRDDIAIITGVIYNTKYERANDSLVKAQREGRLGECLQVLKNGNNASVLACSVFSKSSCLSFSASAGSSCTLRAETDKRGDR